MNKKNIIIFLVFFLFIVLFVSVLDFYDQELFPNDYSTIIKDRNGDILRIFLNKDEEYIFPPVNGEIENKFKRCVITFEDKRFYKHIGVDIIALLRAVYQDIKKWKIVSGASTITMQVCRMSRPKNRTFFNKIVEILHAFAIELKYSKDEILQMYLEHAPYGGNIRGYKAATLLYYGKSPDELTWAEAATLAVLPNSPDLITPYKSRQRLIDKRNRLLKRLYKNNTISKETYSLSIKEKIPVKRYDLPFFAPHLCDRIYLDNKNKYVDTTIDLKLQKNINAISKEYLEFLKSFDVNNLSVIIVDNKKNEILTYIGNPEYFDIKNSGMVDGVSSARSTGSILKPMLYAASIEKGIITMKSLLWDIPSYFGAYSPVNYDKRYRGVVHASQALISSLNVPAVRLLNQYGLSEFYDLLKNNGMSTLKHNCDYYGLTLIIGGAEGNLIDLTNMYATFANKGIYNEIDYIKNNKKHKKNVKIYSEVSVYNVLDVLKDVKRPGVEYYWKNFSSGQNIAWKTGTSFGNKDAWAIGVNADYTVGVWTGNFDGHGSPYITGAQSSAPLLFDVFNFLGKGKWFDKPLKYRKINLCKLSGYRAGVACEDIIEHCIPVDSNLKECDLHSFAWVDSKENYSYCSKCWKGVDVNKKSIFNLPPEVSSFLRQYSDDIWSNKIKHNPKCDFYKGENSINIIYPADNAKIIIPRGVDGTFQKINIKAYTINEKEEIFWYFNGEFIEKTLDLHSLFIEPVSGKNTIVIVDKNGNTAQKDFYVYKKEND